MFAISKLGWIRRQRRKLTEQQRETPRLYLDRESHYVWGKRYLLEIRESAAAPSVELKHGKLLLKVRPGATRAKRREVLNSWHRAILRDAAATLVAKWEPVMSVKVAHVFVQQMKTKWGGCNHRARTIRLNTELAKKPRECLEYIVVHEMAHLLEPTHSDRFKALLDQLMPSWQACRAELNRLPVRHEKWSY